MNIREHLDALCDVKVWWRKGGVKWCIARSVEQANAFVELLDSVCGKYGMNEAGVSLEKLGAYLAESMDEKEARLLAMRMDDEQILSAFKGRNMHKEYPGHVLYVKFHGEETTMYLLDSNGALVKRGVLLRNPSLSAKQ